MKQIRLLSIISLLLTVTMTSCSNRQELYEITDHFVKELANDKESYSIFEVKENTKKTSNNAYQIMPSGRLIIVKFIDYVEETEYEDLLADLKSHYSEDKRVNDVYINKGGTVVIDCRR